MPALEGPTTRHPWIWDCPGSVVLYLIFTPQIPASLQYPPQQSSWVSQWPPIGTQSAKLG